MRADRMLAIRITEELYERLKELARREERSTSFIARRLFERGLEEWVKDGKLEGVPPDEQQMERVVMRVLRREGLVESKPIAPRPEKKIVAKREHVPTREYVLPTTTVDRKKARG